MARYRFQRQSQLRSAAALLALVFLAGCDYLPDRKRVTDEASQMAKAAGEQIARSSDAPLDEVKKLRQFEYHVFRVPLQSDAAEVERKLTLLGKERWDCFHVERLETDDDQELQFFCKRMPATPLMYVPRGLVGR